MFERNNNCRFCCPNIFLAGFMAYVERDAKQRAATKKNEIKQSNYLKTMGNSEYRKGNYEKALIYYNQVSEFRLKPNFYSSKDVAVPFCVFIKYRYYRLNISWSTLALIFV